MAHIKFKKEFTLVSMLYFIDSLWTVIKCGISKNYIESLLGEVISLIIFIEQHSLSGKENKNPSFFIDPAFIAFMAWSNLACSFQIFF